MPLPSLVTVAAPAADDGSLRAGCLLQPPVFSSSRLFPGPSPTVDFLLPALCWLPTPRPPLFLCHCCFSVFVPVNSSPPGLPALDLRGEGVQGKVLSLCLAPRFQRQPHPLPRTFHSSGNVVRAPALKTRQSAQQSSPLGLGGPHAPQEWVSGTPFPICSPFPSTGLHIFAMQWLTRPFAGGFERA